MTITLPPLPYDKDALEPHISSKTLDFHYGKHHAKYVENANNMIRGTDLENADLVEIIKAAKSTSNQGLFNNAAQVWNHTFYWLSMKRGGGGEPTGRLAELIGQAFGSYAEFRKDFEAAGNTAFGSGWAWLVWSSAENKLKVLKTSNAETPLTDETLTPLLTMDVWEHAYYLDYQNLRPTYVTTFMDHLVNWDFVASNLPN